MKTKSKSVLSKLWKEHREIVVGGVFLVVILVLFLMLQSANKENTENKTLINSIQAVLNDKDAKITELEDELDDAKKHTVVITDATLSQAFEDSAELVTQKYIYTNAAKYESNDLKLFNFTLPFGTKSIVVTYDGEIDAGVDLRDITFRVDEEKRTIQITMPESKVTNNNIPQEKIVVVTVKNGLFNEITIDDYNTFISEQKVIMEARAIENGLLTQADTEARRIVETTLSLLPGIEEYEVVFG